MYTIRSAAAAALAECVIITIVWAYWRCLTDAKAKAPWVLGGLAAVFVGVTLAWPIFFGLARSRLDGKRYQDGLRHGYVQRLEDVRMRERGLLPWEAVGDYIRQHSRPEDTVYVWGWVPGIYVRAQRLSCVRQSFISDMHVMAPQKLGNYTEWLILQMERNGLPAYIVDSRKRHFPWDRPPLELWPLSSRGPIAVAELEQYEKIYRGLLAEKVDQEEAARFEAMGVFRRFVMKHYQVVPGRFGEHVVLARRSQATAAGEGHR